jgi:hypothetical protein
MKKSITDVLKDREFSLGFTTMMVLNLLPVLVYCVISPYRFLALLLLVLEGRCAAIAIRKTGMSGLREPVNPWYARSYSLIFLIVYGLFVNILVVSIDSNLSDIIVVSNNIPIWARAMALTPIELAWLVLLDWRTVDVPNRGASNWTHIPRNPHSQL